MALFLLLCSFYINNNPLYFALSVLQSLSLRDFQVKVNCQVWMSYTNNT